MTRQDKKEHLAITREAGISRVSLVSVIAGLVSAYGAFAIVAAIVGASLSKAHVSTNFRTNDWTGSGAVAGLASAVALLVAYLFGGYVAGRMARRAGMLHGFLVFLTSLIVAAVAGGVVAALTDNKDIRSNLRSIGVPTSTDQLKGVAIASAGASLAAILIGAVAGGALGERWHTKLARRAADPAIGPAAESRALATEQDDARRQQVAADPAVRREVAGQEQTNVDQEAANRQAAEQEQLAQEAAQRQAAELETAQREAAAHEAAARQAAEQEAAQREAAQRQVAERQAAEQEAAQRQAGEGRATEQDSTKESQGGAVAVDRPGSQGEGAVADPSARPAGSQGQEPEFLTDDQWREREAADRRRRGSGET